MGNIMVLRGGSVSHMTHGEAYLRDILQLVEKQWPKEAGRCKRHADDAIASGNEECCYEVGRAWAYEYRAYARGENRF
jgi:hypothetical protein